MKRQEVRTTKAAERFFQSMVESLFAAGIFSEQDIADKASLGAAVQRIIDRGGLDAIVVDHTESIISEARKYRKRKDDDYSRIFFATYFEHQANELVHLYCLRNKIDRTTQSAIIQSVNIKGKFTWLFQLLGFPAFNKDHLKTILELADCRNAFVHYKWKDYPHFDRTDWKELDEATENEFVRIERAARYFKTYCSKLKLGGKKGHLKSLTK